MIRSGFLSSVLECVRREGDCAEADEGEGEDDQPAEGLSLGQDDDKNELDRVHGRVQPILDLIETHFKLSVWIREFDLLFSILISFHISSFCPDT